MKELIIDLNEFKIPEPYCKKCREKYEIRVDGITGEDGRPIALVYGLCHRCQTIMMELIIDVVKKKGNARKNRRR